MVTFADLMSLLLTFFVLLLSFPNTEIIKFRVMAGSVRDALGMKSEFSLSDIPMGDKLLPHRDPAAGEVKAAQMELTAEEVREMLENSGLERHGEAKATKRGVVLQLSGGLQLQRRGRRGRRTDGGRARDGNLLGQHQRPGPPRAGSG